MMIQFDFFKLTPRLGRVRYFSLTLFWNAIVAIALSGILLSNPDNTFHKWVIVISLIFLLISIVNVVLLQIRRLHDVNLKGWWLLFMLVPVLNLAMALFLLFAPGTAKENRFGPPAPNPDRDDYILLFISLAVIIGAMILYKNALTAVIEQKTTITSTTTAAS